MNPWEPAGWDVAAVAALQKSLYDAGHYTRAADVLLGIWLQPDADALIRSEAAS